jgi:hypothetical protein
MFAAELYVGIELEGGLVGGCIVQIVQMLGVFCDQQPGARCIVAHDQSMSQLHCGSMCCPC